MLGKAPSRSGANRHRRARDVEADADDERDPRGGSPYDRDDERSSSPSHSSSSSSSQEDSPAHHDDHYYESRLGTPPSGGPHARPRRAPPPRRLAARGPRSARSRAPRLWWHSRCAWLAACVGVMCASLLCGEVLLFRAAASRRCSGVALPSVHSDVVPGAPAGPAVAPWATWWELRWGLGGLWGGGISPSEALRGGKERDLFVMVADPQIIDVYSYRYMRWSENLAHVVQLLADLYMKKSYKLIADIHKPSVLFRLGDMFDSGSILNDTEFDVESQRLDWIFPQRQSISMFSICGNHDFQFLNPGKDKELGNRFSSKFGPLHFMIKIHGINFIGLCTPAIRSAESVDRFNYTYKETDKNVLLIHTPLMRQENTDCGMFSKQGPISTAPRQRYSNVLSHNVSEALIKHFHPSAVFSGDNHDHCTVKHSSGIIEHTVGAFGMTNGLEYGSYILGVFYPELNHPAPFLVCYLPRQYRLYGLYAFVLVILLIATEIRLCMHPGSSHCCFTCCASLVWFMVILCCAAICFTLNIVFQYYTF
ncbi:Metallo-dependent phosphatase [Pelomyxa schiedti]|nr:Metallo-dependent phosphatase [Pelomyxa schiedti]